MKSICERVNFKKPDYNNSQGKLLIPKKALSYYGKMRLHNHELDMGGYPIYGKTLGVGAHKKIKLSVKEN